MCSSTIKKEGTMTSPAKPVQSQKERDFNSSLSLYARIENLEEAAAGLREALREHMKQNPDLCAKCQDKLKE